VIDAGMMLIVGDADAIPRSAKAIIPIIKDMLNGLIFIS
jgi:hypothetical protein